MVFQLLKEYRQIAVNAGFKTFKKICKNAINASMTST